jgi:LysM repeat protein
MDPNERLLWRVVQERSGHSRFVSLRNSWLLFGAGALVLVLAVALVRTMLLSHSGPSVGAAAGVSELDVPATPAPVSIVRSQVTPVAAAVTPEITALPRPIRYVVQPGDSLQSVAARNGLRPATLASLNQLDQPDLLQPGSSLLVPATDGVVHVVEPGETLRAIAAQYGVDVDRIISANQLEDPDHIQVGLRLFIPVESN